jgi:hypothetical protein
MVTRNIGWSAGFVAAGLVAGAMLAGTVSAAAQTPAPSPSTSAPAAPGAGEQRSNETPLTGSNLEKAKAAALAKVPGATIRRVETEADGNGAYEVHLTKPDGTPATVYLDEDFAVTSVVDGRAGGRHGGRDCPEKDGTGTGGGSGASADADAASAA